MKYKLVKQLKDAGFPQEICGGDIVYFDNKKYIHLGGGHLNSNGIKEGLYAEYSFSCCLDKYNKEDSDLSISSVIFNIDNAEVVLIPSISELIEACGEDFLNLYKTKDGIFHCVNPFEDKDDSEGLSPEEAVTNLYLKLHEKETA